MLDSQLQSLQLAFGKCFWLWLMNCKGEQEPKGLAVWCDMKDLISVPLQKVFWGFLCEWNKLKSGCCLQIVAELKHLARQIKCLCPSFSDSRAAAWGNNDRPTLSQSEVQSSVFLAFCPAFNLRCLWRYLVWRADLGFLLFMQSFSWVLNLHKEIN